MLRKFIHSSIKPDRLKLDNWSKINRCVLCTNTTRYIPWCKACVADLPSWNTKPLKIPNVDEVRVAFRYEYPIDRLIQVAKYRSNYVLSQALSGLMPKCSSATPASVLFPIPVSRKRLLSRGFNQTRILAEHLYRENTCFIDEVSIHKRWLARDQSSLSAKQRQSNAKSLFNASFSKPAAPHAVIIDDVITTGATISAVASILRANGAQRIDAIALAAVR